MDQSDFEEFYAAWTSTCELISGKTPTDGAVDLCFTVLSRFSIAEIRQALSGHLNNPESGRFIPKPADIVRQIDGDSESRALMAWSKVEGAMISAGSYRTVVFDEPEIMACIVNMGGWIRLCEMLEDDLPYRRNEFCKLYKGFVVSKPVNYPSKFIGRQEAHNRQDNKKFVTPPTMIGDYSDAVKVLQSDKSIPKRQRVFTGNISKLLGKTNA